MPLIAVSILCAVFLLWLAAVMWNFNKIKNKHNLVQEEIVRRCFESGKIVIANKQPDGSIKIEELDY